MNQYEVLVHLAFVEVFISEGIVLEFTEEVLGSLFLHVVQALFVVLLESTVYDSQKEIHDQEKSADEVKQEEDEIQPAGLVRRQHDIWVVRGRH